MATRFYWLTPPSRPVFIISVLLAILALLVRYTGAQIPLVSGNVFETLLIAYLVLLAGNLFRGFLPQDLPAYRPSPVSCFAGSVARLKAASVSLS